MLYLEAHHLTVDSWEKSSWSQVEGTRRLPECWQEPPPRAISRASDPRCSSSSGQRTGENEQERLSIEYDLPRASEIPPTPTVHAARAGAGRPCAAPLARSRRYLPPIRPEADTSKFPPRQADCLILGEMRRGGQLAHAARVHSALTPIPTSGSFTDSSKLPEARHSGIGRRGWGPGQRPAGV